MAAPTFKVALFGDSGVGKSSLLARFLADRFDEHKESSVGVEFGSRQVKLGNEVVQVQVWDTAGAKAYRPITQSYYSGISGLLLVYDVSLRETFESIPRWLEEIRKKAHPKVVIMLLGNKGDAGSLAVPQEVTTEEAQEFASQHGLHFKVTSARTGLNVEETFRQLTGLLRSNVQNEVYDPEDLSNLGIEVPNGPVVEVDEAKALCGSDEESMRSATPLCRILCRMTLSYASQVFKRSSPQMGAALTSSEVLIVPDECESYGQDPSNTYTHNNDDKDSNASHDSNAGPMAKDCPHRPLAA